VKIKATKEEWYPVIELHEDKGAEVDLPEELAARYLIALAQFRMASEEVEQHLRETKQWPYV